MPSRFSNIRHGRVLPELISIHMTCLCLGIEVGRVVKYFIFDSHRLIFIAVVVVKYHEYFYCWIVWYSVWPFSFELTEIHEIAHCKRLEGWVI